MNSNKIVLEPLTDNESCFPSASSKFPSCSVFVYFYCVSGKYTFKL